MNFVIRIAVVDDEKECVIKIRKYPQTMNRSDLEYYLFDDMCSLINEYDEGNVFDILFLDIEMNSLNGVDGAHRNILSLPQQEPPILLIRLSKQYGEANRCHERAGSFQLHGDRISGRKFHVLSGRGKPA